MSEWRMILLLGCAPILWMAGGTWKKFWRRFVWPLFALITTWGLISNWLVVGMGLTLIGTATLPYGDRTSWLVRFIVFTMLGAHVIWLDPIFGLWWALGTAIVLSAYMALSQRYNRATHKIFEFLAGGLQASGIILGVLR